jgi:elongation factor Ts
MAEITAALVKELRDKTGAGMMDCKKALSETAGNIEDATDWLRKKGIASAAKKAGRVAAEGLVGLAVEGTNGALVEVNSETDFVARNETFQGFVKTVAGLALAAGGDIEKLAGMTYPDGARTVSEELTEMIAKIGENMTLRRTASLSVGKGVIASYMHNAAGEGLGKIGVLVALESDGDAGKLAAFGKQLAMHIAAANPQSVAVADLDQAAVERERNILREQAAGSGKPAEIVEKMVEGRLRKFYEDVVLLDQIFVIDGESRVAKAIEAAAKDVGAPIKVAGFVRYALGEGIERESDDFADEVAKLTS